MSEKLTELFVKIGADTTGLDKGLKRAETRAQGFANKFGRQMKIAGAAMVGLTAAIGGASLKMASDFDSAMREVNTMMLLSEDQFADFSKEVQEVAKDLGVSATDAANALYQAISAGIPRENAIEFLQVATKAAIGGVTDTTTAVDGLTTVMNAFKMPVSDAQKVADIMFTTVKGGKTTFEELSASMFNVAPIAAAIGVKFETVSAALATMTKQGVPTAQATTQLRQAMVALSRPTTEMQTAIEELGYASGQAMVEQLGFAKTINVLADATEGNNEQLMRMFGSVEAGQAILSLTGDNAEMFGADLEAMAGSAGAATDAFDQMEQTTARKFAKIKAQLMDMAITIGTALMPTLEKLMAVITPIVEKISDWIEKHPKLTVALLAGVGALGAILLILPPLISALSALKVITIVATAVQWAWNAALTANPIGLIIVAIAAAIAIIVLLIKHFDKVKAVFEAVANFIVSTFKTAWDTLVVIVKTAVNFVLGIINGLITGFEGAINFVIKGINSFIGLMNKPIQLLNKIPGVNLPLIPTVGEISLPRIPLLDTGGLIEGPGLFAVGPGVKEVVREPSGGVVNNYFQGPWFIREEADIDKIARELYNLQQRKARAKGVA